MNIRHELDQVKVKESVDCKVAKYNEYRVKDKTTHDEWKLAISKDPKVQWQEPQNHDEVDKMYDEWIDRELNYYALVRVIELPQKGKRFILVYGDSDDSTITNGTGPSESFDRSAEWFYKHGR